MKGSRKAYRAHLTRIWGKLEELNLTLPATDETITTVTSYIDQIQRKAESIQQLDSRIQSVIKEPSDIESDVLDSLEIHDTIIEKMTRPRGPPRSAEIQDLTNLAKDSRFKRRFKDLR